MQNFVHIYTISDSTGETVQGLSTAVGVQFDNVKHKDWTLVKTVEKIESIGKSINSNTVVIYTMVDSMLIDALENICKRKKAICLSPMDSIFRAITSLGGKSSKRIVAGKQHIMNDQYFSRVEAMNFVVQQDDGQNPENLLQSDVIILGVSRTSKSPTCIYLANKGIKASNVPFINNISLPKILANIPKDGPLVVALNRDAKSLVDIRLSRLKSLSVNENINYIDIKKIREEISALKKVCMQNGWPIINVNTKSVEETATQIINYMENRK